MEFEFATKRIAILTCVGNTENGNGPGHTAIVVGNRAFSFEDWQNQGSNGSGWIAKSTSSYLAQDNNTCRPVIFQELKDHIVDSTAVLKYIAKSRVADDDYLTAGVCSSQVANAVDAGTRTKFNPKGIDTPYRVFKLAEQLGFVQDTYMIWADPKENGASKKMDVEYKSVTKSGNALLAWT